MKTNRKVLALFGSTALAGAFLLPLASGTIIPADEHPDARRPIIDPWCDIRLPQEWPPPFICPGFLAAPDTASATVADVEVSALPGKIPTIPPYNPFPWPDPHSASHRL